MRRTVALVALGASGALLAGCAAAPSLPEPMTTAEKQQLAAELQSQWWDSMFPGEPEPVVEPIGYLDAESSGEEISQCVAEVDLEGLTVSADGSWTYAGPDQRAMDRAFFVCVAQHPYDPAQQGYLSDAEREWNYNYNKNRLVPCLQLLGYPVVNRTLPWNPDELYWEPYYEMGAVLSVEEWARVDFACPPSPVGSSARWRPTQG